MVSNKALIFIGLSVILSMTVFSGYQYVFEANFLVEKPDQRICIPKGMDFNELLKNLNDAEIVHEPLSFALLAKIMKYRDNVKPGCYMLQKNMTNVQAIRLLRSGKQIEEKLTFSNARFIEDLAGALCENTIADSTKMALLLKDPAVAKKYGFTPETFISMFIPNTYYVYWSTDEEAILDRLKFEYDKFWTDERIAKAKKLNLSKVEISTLASIVYNESKDKNEQPKVAGLYLNRLKLPMLLQADPTVKFAVGDFSIKQVLNKHTAFDSPYNTYKTLGLPPGPISMPDVQAIDAVLNAEKHDYLYMCAVGDGSEKHNFATSLNGHIKNIRIHDLNQVKRGKRKTVR